MISIETYSERGMVLRGDLDTARRILAEAAPKAMTQEQRGGLVVSRKYEAAVREVLARANMTRPHKDGSAHTGDPVLDRDDRPY